MLLQLVMFTKRKMTGKPRFIPLRHQFMHLSMGDELSGPVLGVL